MKKRQIACILIATAVLLSTITMLALLRNKPAFSTAQRYTYNVLIVYPHDSNVFTQGLVFENGVMYEGTGLYGQSTLRRVELETGKILQSCTLPNQFFGEGITIFGDKIIQLTWRKSNKGFVYVEFSFDLLPRI